MPTALRPLRAARVFAAADFGKAGSSTGTWCNEEEPDDSSEASTRAERMRAPPTGGNWAALDGRGLEVALGGSALA
eukprot:15438152-Alexandrium_andersonii.AAC.1